MKVQLIQPVIAKYRQKKAVKWVTPPLGLAMLAALSPDVEYSVTDEAIDNIDFEKHFDLVGIRTDTCVSSRAYQIADVFRDRGIKVVLGGPHPSLCPEEAIQHADAVVVGEAEGIWQRLLRDCEQNKLERIYRLNEPLNLAGLPLPRRDIFNKSNYLFLNTIFATRGCSYSCSFCSIGALWGNGIRTRPIDEILHEVETLEGNTMFFIDDNLVGNPEFAKELFRALIPYKKKWGCQATLTIARDEELLRVAAESGCIAVSAGFESASAANLAYIDKNSNIVEEYEENVKIIHSYGIAIQGSFIFGLDHDDPGVFQQTVRLAQRLKLEAAWFAPLHAYPGTSLFSSMEKEGRILSRDWSKFTDAPGWVNFEPKLISAREMEAGVRYAWKKFYGFISIWKRMGIKGRNRRLFWLVNLGLRYYSTPIGSKLRLLQRVFNLFLELAKMVSARLGKRD
ncbi:B12-binding domain-containing radical SAM protein [Chloroflexota bacterium]